MYIHTNISIKIYLYIFGISKTILKQLKFNSVYSNFQYNGNFKTKKMEINNFQIFYCSVFSRISKTGEGNNFIRHIFKQAVSFIMI